MDGFVYGALRSRLRDRRGRLLFMACVRREPEGVMQGFCLRIVASGLYGHVLYTGLVGMAVGLVVSRRSTERAERPAWAAAGLCAARGRRAFPLELAAAGRCSRRAVRRLGLAVRRRSPRRSRACRSSLLVGLGVRLARRREDAGSTGPRTRGGARRHLAEELRVLRVAPDGAGRRGVRCAAGPGAGPPACSHGSSANR